MLSSRGLNPSQATDILARGHDAESLQAAFNYFNETSEQLAKSYRLLESKVHQLTAQLDEVSAQKDQEIQQKVIVESRMQALLDFLPGGVVVLDASGNIIESNPAAETFLDLPLVGKLWRHVIADCFSPQNDDGLEVSTKSGRRISIATSSMEDRGQIILLTDLTETRQLQQHVSRNEKLSAMGKMVSALAHQIRTPLSAATLYAGHLQNPLLDDDKKQEFSQKILGRLQHMEKQVRDMMLFVKSELPLNDIISLADLELGLRQACEVPLQIAKAQCEWQNSAADQHIKCHREALISAIMNLVNNGLQSRTDHAQLVIRLFRVERNGLPYAVICVKDNGEGMTAEQLARSRELFFTSKSQGTGLGLAVVQSVARAHGANFQLASEPGQGCEGIIVIPLYFQD